MGDSREKDVDAYIGEQIKANLGDMTLTELASRLGIGVSTLSMSTNGNLQCRSGRVFRIAEELNLPVETFYPERGADVKALLKEIRSKKKKRKLKPRK